MEATAATAPASGAGTGSASGGSPSSQASTSNSAGQTSQPQRQQASAAQPSSPKPQQPAAPAQNAAPDDPEIEWTDGKKYKRSFLDSQFKRFREQQAGADRARTEAIARAEKAEALAQHLNKIGIEVDQDAFARDPQGALNNALSAHRAAWIQQQIEEAQLSPEELQLRRREETLQEREARIQAQEQQAQETQRTAAVEARANEFAQQFHQVLEANPQLPRHPKTIARMAELVLAAARNGRQLPPHELANRVAEQVSQEQAYFAATLKGNAQGTAAFIKPLLSHFDGNVAAFAEAAGPKFMDDVRQYILQQADKFNQPNKPTQRAPSKPKIMTDPKQKNGYITYDQMLAASRRQ